MRSALVALLLGLPVMAQETDLQKLRQDLEESRKRIEALEKAESERQVEKKGGDGSLGSLNLGAGATARLVDLSIDVLLAAGLSTARDAEIERLQFAHHDPKRRGFTVQNVELSAVGAVDPYFNGEVHIAYVLEPGGESVIELEEAFLTTTCLPGGLELRGGQQFIEFGHINPQHPHAWQFVDVPVVASRFFGEDGLRSQGARVAWLAPLPWHFNLIAGVYNADAETTFSFDNEDAPFPGLHENRDTRSGRDMLLFGRLAQEFEIGETISSTLGFSFLHGPNASGRRAETDIFGVDLHARWRPGDHHHGWPFVQFQAEFLVRRYERAAADDLAGTEFEHEIFQDWGWYAQLVWGFTHGWSLGVRWDQADGEIDDENFLHDARFRVSPALTWSPTEFSRIRIQYNYDHASHISSGRGHDEHSVWLQVEFLLGRHKSHEHDETHDHAESPLARGARR